tara:strand:+ start:614 stop:1030 length:417 start_codon:yes stop_codon:yes gene_type:complete
MNHFYNNGIEMLRAHSQSQTRQKKDATKKERDKFDTAKENATANRSEHAVPASEMTNLPTKTNKTTSLSANTTTPAGSKESVFSSTVTINQKRLTYMLIVMLLSALLMIFTSCGSAKLSNPNLDNPENQIHETKFRIV